MANEQITFDKLPQAVGYLTEQMEQIRQMVAALQPQTSLDKHRLIEIVKLRERRSLPFTRLRVKDRFRLTNEARNYTSMKMSCYNGLSPVASRCRQCHFRNRQRR